MMYSLIPFEKYNAVMDRFFDDIPRVVFGGSGEQAVAFRTDIRDKGDHFLLEADLPGFRKDDITLDVKGDMMTISASSQAENQEENGRYLCRERRYGSFQRSFDVSAVNRQGITAAYENGVLKVNLPKKSAQQPESSRIVID